MRLTPYQIEALKSTAKEVFGPRSTLLLFGSRTDDSQRGGDIDLCVTGYHCSADEQLEAKLRFLVKAKQKIGEQRIDLIFIPPSNRSPKPIYRVAQQTGILL